MLKPLIFLVDAFVNTFGITQPTRAGAAHAARILGWVLLALVLTLAGLASTLFHALSRR